MFVANSTDLLDNHRPPQKIDLRNLRVCFRNASYFGAWCGCDTRSGIGLWVFYDGFSLQSKTLSLTASLPFIRHISFVVVGPFFGTSFYADCNMSVLLITLQHKWIFVKCRIFKEWLALPNQQGKSQPYKQGKSQTSLKNPNSTRKIQSQQGKPKPNKENLSQQVKYHPTRNIRKNRCQWFVGQRRFSFSAFISVFAKPYYLFLSLN